MIYMMESSDTMGKRQDQGSDGRTKIWLSTNVGCGLQNQNMHMTNILLSVISCSDSFLLAVRTGSQIQPRATKSNPTFSLAIYALSC